MNFKSDIFVYNNFKKVYNCLLPEKDSIITDRCRIELKLLKDKFKISIIAKDAVSFRAATNGIIKQLIIFEKMVNLNE